VGRTGNPSRKTRAHCPFANPSHGGAQRLREIAGKTGGAYRFVVKDRDALGGIQPSKANAAGDTWKYAASFAV
jgi:hypothetical protein